VTHQTTMYFSGSMTHPHVVERLVDTQVHRLFTFAAPKEAPEYLRHCEARGKPCTMMLDSGAFTAWNIGKPVQLRNLIEYNKGILRQFPNQKFVFIALDVIPGARGRNATEGEIKAAVEESYSNFVTMVQEFQGQMVLPVYHSGEDRSIRDRYLRHANYICLSMNQNLAENQRLQWAREAMVPGYYFHGLAATGNAMLSRVDWYSVDSSGWLMVAAMGSILFPIGEKLRPLSVSDTAPTRKQAGKHLENMHESVWICDYIRSRGYDPQQLMTDYAARICWNIDQWNAPPWRKNIIQPEGLFQ
jgi:hypothetical protein